MGVKMAKYNKNEKRLSALQASKLPPRTSPYPDGGGLYLQVTTRNARSWLFKFSIDHRRREMGLGQLRNVSLAEARESRDAARKLLARGIDPIVARDQGIQREAEANAIEQAKKVTFEDAATRYIEAKRPEWRNIKHAEQWTDTLRDHAFPVFGSVPVQVVDLGLVLKALEPIWTRIPETASRTRGRIEAVLDWAKVHGYRDGENPARWRGHLALILAKRSKTQVVQHHSALPYTEICAFVHDLRTREGIAERALEFLILTAARTGEVLGATWDEFNLRKSVWTIPGERMKNGKEHQVPLSGPAVAVLERMSKITNGEHIFFGQSSGRSLSNMALLVLLRRMKRTDITSHGFRSTFRDWAAERGYPDAVAEAALAHSVSDAVISAYRRTTFFELRKKMMDDWATFATSDPAHIADVLPFAPVATAN
jgi:integrase